MLGAALRPSHLDQVGRRGRDPAELLGHPEVVAIRPVLDDRAVFDPEPVLFWGDTWWTSNILSGGTAPAAFKGFAASPSVPACGTNWVTRVGGSSSPPAGPLPDYLSVIVSSSVSQSGVAISGDTTGIVVVKADPGYGPLPTEHGTGTVVATAC
jgi:hypothetical protein